jgi:hypothetical protein
MGQPYFYIEGEEDIKVDDNYFEYDSVIDKMEYYEGHMHILGSLYHANDMNLPIKERASRVLLSLYYRKNIPDRDITKPFTDGSSNCLMKNAIFISTLNSFLKK